jgi:hypothetical protein
MQEVRTKVARAIALQLQKSQHKLNLDYIRFKHQLASSLEIIPPIYAPESYEVPCISIHPSGQVSFGWRPLSRAASAKMERMFHPVIFSQAFWSGVKAFSTTTFTITKARALDWLYGPEPATIVLQLRKAHGLNAVTSIRFSRPLSREQTIIVQLPINQIPDQQAVTTLPFLRGDSEKDSNVKKNYRNVLNSTTYKDAIEHAATVFKQTWISRQMTAVKYSSGGVCSMRGTIDCIGERGKYRLEVSALYIPSEDVFIGKPLITKSYIIPDLPKFEAKSIPAPGTPIEKPASSVHQPPISAEKPTPGKDAGK